MLVAKGIFKSYGSLPILKGIDLEINEAEVVSIVGSSGAGKTTLLQILGTLDSPDQGELVINGIHPFQLSSNELSRFRNEQIGFIFQFHQLLPEFSALENVCMPALIGGQTMAAAQVRGLQLLERLGVKERAEHKPSELSGGEQQRVAVCRALMNNPKIIFADEPSGNLDSQNSEALHNLFFELRDELGCSFVIVTHNDKLANMADRKLTMRDGLIESES
jgi:lipoprotein-releasing system ATP-binding protein